MSRGSIALTAFLFSCLSSFAEAQPTTERFGFEEDAPGQIPKKWLVPTPGYQVEVMAGDAQEGEHYVRLLSKDKEGKAPFGNLMQCIPAGPYHGRLVRFKAAVRTQVAGDNQAQLWFRVDRPNQSMGFFDNMDDRPITAAEWKPYEIVGPVAENAEQICFGLMLIKEGRVDLDDVSLEIVGEAPAPVVEGPRPLKEKELDNIVAFTRLLGYVRYFHPSDQAAVADWDAFAIRGVREVEPAGSAVELAEKLDALFRPMAPTVRVFPTGQQPEIPAELKAAPKPGKVTIVKWEHYGLGQASETKKIEPDEVFSRLLGHKSGRRQIYRSERKRVKLSDGKVPVGCPDPAKPYIADLGGGVSCMIPLAVYADKKGTFPGTKKAPAEQEPAPPKPRQTGLYTAGGLYSAEDRATRLGAVILAWNVFQHFYPYFDAVKTDWNLALRRALEKAATDADERAFLDTLRELVAQLHDGHGNVWHACDTDCASLPLAWTWVEDKLVVTYVAPDVSEGPHRGDVVEKIDGHAVAELWVEAERLISGATPQWRRWRALNVLATGREDSKVELSLKKPDGTQYKVTLRRRQRPEPLDEPRPEKIAEVRPGVYYVDVGRVTDEDFTEAIAKLAEAKGIIFDFRGYPRTLNAFLFFSHLIQKGVTSAQWHVPLVVQPDRKDMRFDRSGEWSISPAEPYFKARKAFVVDGRAISYAESCLGIIEHYKLGDIVGGPSAGTNGNVNTFEIPGGYRTAWTGMKVLKHDGSQHHGVGILPTVPVSRTIPGIAEGRDEALERAIDLVSE